MKGHDFGCEILLKSHFCDVCATRTEKQLSEKQRAVYCMRTIHLQMQLARWASNNPYHILFHWFYHLQLAFLLIQRPL